ncbi:hypothetical protein [uncultured Akkermansia sp.]|jgi:hypothetical protein|uniref:hypothetical protein n=1 Tax=uncultured Akkermansia sp. TaxID=512294 RepID=UPI0025D8D1BC|nr:hypothetical protein [uncultured Akkermansia sp.]
MKCVFLQTPGETMEGLAEMNSLGFECVAYPSTQDTSSLRDTRYEEFASFLDRVPDWTDTSKVRSLRASFARMLLDPAFEDDDFIIFGESDSTPTVDASVLRKAVEEEFLLHPEVDILRPFLELATGPSLPPTCPAHLRFEPLHTSPRTLDSPYVWGTHALIIPVRSRRKVADLFLDWRLPIDTTMEAACAEGKLSMRITPHNLFYQKPRTSSINLSQEPGRNRRMALCLSSYKRPEDLQRQIFSMMNQSYGNFHLFVAVKGIPEFFVNTFIIPQFQHFIEAGKLTIRCFPNGNQLSNLLDTVRGIDTSGFELFLKIDDDDFYCRDYLKTINEFCETVPDGYSCYCSDWSWVLYKHGGVVSPQKEPFYVFGSSLVMSREVMEQVWKSETEPEIIRRIMAKYYGGEGHSRIAWSEDNFLHKLMMDFGCGNIAPFVSRKGMKHFLMVQRSNASVTRGGLVPGDAVQHVDVANASSPREMVLTLIHPEWMDTVRIYGQSSYRVSNGDRARVVRQTDSSITLGWEKWGEELFVRNPDGSYHLK